MPFCQTCGDDVTREEQTVCERCSKGQAIWNNVKEAVSKVVKKKKKPTTADWEEYEREAENFDRGEGDPPKKFPWKIR